MSPESRQERRSQLYVNAARLSMIRTDSAAQGLYDDTASTVNRADLTADQRDYVDLKIQMVYFVLGCAGLMPSTLLFAVLPFFQSRVLGSPFAGLFSSYLSIASTSAGFVCLAHATAVAKSSIPTRQTRRSIVALLAFTLLITISALVPSTPHAYFIFIMFMTIFGAGTVSYLNSPVFAVASLFGPKALQAVMIGQSAVGVVVNFVQLVSAAISLRPGGVKAVHVKKTPEETTAFICFTFATCVLCASLFAHTWLVTTPAYKILIVPIENRITAAGELEERHALLGSSETPKERETTRERLIRVAKANILYEIAVAYVFMVTLSVFPPLTIEIKPVNPHFHPLLFAAAQILLFSLGDLFGRHLCSFPSLLFWAPRKLLSLSLAHTLFIPLFIACNLQLPSASPAELPLLHSISAVANPAPLINSDFIFFLIVFFFGASNGYTSTLCLLAAPSLQHNKKLKNQGDVDTAVNVGLFCMVGGLTVGSFASIGIRAIVCKCNPFGG